MEVKDRAAPLPPAAWRLSLYVHVVTVHPPLSEAAINNGSNVSLLAVGVGKKTVNNSCFLNGSCSNSGVKVP